MIKNHFNKDLVMTKKDDKELEKCLQDVEFVIRFMMMVMLK